MPEFDQVAWLPLCAGLTGVGLAASWLLWRRRGAAAGLRLAGWSLLPLAIYLVGAVEMVWGMVTAAVSGALGFVISPGVWAGVCLLGLAVMLLAVSGRLRRRGGANRPVERGPSSASGTVTRAKHTSDTLESAASGHRGSSRGSSSGGDGAANGDEDFSDVEEILRRRGIR